MKNKLLLLLSCTSLFTISYGQKQHDIDSLDNLYPFFTEDYRPYAQSENGYQLTGNIEEGITPQWDALFHGGSIHYFGLKNDTLSHLCYLHKENLWVQSASMDNIYVLEYMKALDNQAIETVFVDTAFYFDRKDKFEQYIYQRPWNERVMYAEAKKINDIVFFNYVFSGSAYANCEDDVYEYSLLDSCITEAPILTCAVYNTKKKQWHIAPGTYKSIALDRKRKIVARNNNDDYYLLDGKGREKLFLHSSADIVKMRIGESERGLFDKNISIFYSMGYKRTDYTFHYLISYNLKKSKSYAYYKLVFPCYDLYNLGY